MLNKIIPAFVNGARAHGGKAAIGVGAAVAYRYRRGLARALGEAREYVTGSDERAAAAAAQEAARLDKERKLLAQEIVQLQWDTLTSKVTEFALELEAEEAKAETRAKAKAKARNKAKTTAKAAANRHVTPRKRKDVARVARAK